LSSQIDKMNAHDLLLREARSARDSLAELQEATETKRLDYYQAVRRLHSSGAPMRDIGEALGLSHQRVHQIVNGGGQMAHPTPARKLLHRVVGRRDRKCEPWHVSHEPGEDIFDRFHIEARAAMSGAQDEARAFYHHYIGTEHVLLGLLRTEQSLAVPSRRWLVGVKSRRLSASLLRHE
jgi:Clp amino terminal domain, pathogenicity island component